MGYQAGSFIVSIFQSSLTLVSFSCAGQLEYGFLILGSWADHAKFLFYYMYSIIQFKQITMSISGRYSVQSNLE